VSATIVPVELGARRYEVQIGTFSPELCAEVLAIAFGESTTGVALLVDGGLSAHPRVAALVAALAARLPGVARLDLPAGEASKNLAQIEKTAEWLAAQGYDRRGAIIGIGGGATTDHAGFAAAVYLRGIRFATMPTTLLAMVDASVGGKTGVDLDAGKNLAGVFRDPVGVFCECAGVYHLPPKLIREGLAEIVKHGIIEGGDHFEMLERVAAHPVPRVL